jgi:ribonuclease E
MYQPIVQLKSGGYLVINPTEALVSIDINSGRSTREHNIEQTAFATNLEAAAEIARQLRLRDMAGLVVIDFIDMEQNSHVRKVEKAMKEALKNDRARIQVGRISGFGLMEMSRQRLRTGVLEASTKACPHCEGTGLMRTASSSGLSALRIIEDEAARGRGDRITLRAGREAAIYVLNKKRAELAEIEERYGVTVDIAIDEAFEGARMTVESSGGRPQPKERVAIAPIVEDDEEDYLVEEDEAEEAEEVREEEGERGARRRRRRRRGGRGRSRRESEDGGDDQAPETAEEAEEVPEAEALGAEEEGEKPRSRRGRRGGRGRRGSTKDSETEAVAADEPPMADLPVSEEPAPVEAEPEAEEKPKTRRRPRARKAAEPVAETVEAPAAEVTESEPAAEEKPKRKPRAKKAKAEDAPAAKRAAEAPTPTPEPSNDASEEENGKPRSGWWQRTFG